MAPVTRRALAACSLSGAELGIDTDNNMRYGTARSTGEEGNGPGSTGGRRIYHGSLGVQHFPDMGYGANQPSQADGASNGRFAGQGVHNQRMTAGSGGSRFNRLSRADSDGYNDQHANLLSANTTAHRFPLTDHSRSDPRPRSAVYSSDTGDPYLRTDRSQTAPRLQQPSVYDSDPRRTTRQDLGQQLHEADPDASASHGGQGTGNSEIADVYLLKVQLAASQKQNEAMAAAMKVLQEGQERANANLAQMQRDWPTSTSRARGTTLHEGAPGLAVKKELEELDEKDDDADDEQLKTPANANAHANHAKHVSQAPRTRGEGARHASDPSNAPREPRERRGGDHASHAKHVSQAPRRGGSAHERAIETAT